MERPEHQTPIYNKAKEIEKLVESIIEFVRESDLPKADDFDLDLLNHELLEMEESAHEIPNLILDASLPDLPYDYRMENAVFVKSAAEELTEAALCIKEMGFKDIDYLNILHDEVEALRLLFIEWIQTFELWKYDVEDWGLFTPDGIELVQEGMTEEDFKSFYDSLNEEDKGDDDEEDDEDDD